jgi:hypothetical protein
VVQELKLAQKSRKISMFTFTCEKILHTLIEAKKKRGRDKGCNRLLLSAWLASKHAIEYLKSQHVPIIQGEPKGNCCITNGALIDDKTLTPWVHKLDKRSLFKK